MNDNLSPKALGDTLSPVARSLQSLEISGLNQQFVEGHDGSRLCLRDFAALKTLKLPSLLFFSNWAPSPKGLYKLFPPSVSDITVRPCRISLRQS